MDQQSKPIPHNRSDSNGPGSRRRPLTLAEPLTVAEFWKNRRGESIRVTLSTFENHNIVDLRQFFTDPQGTMRPTKKGLAIVVRRLPDLVAAVNKALKVALESGLLADDGAGE